MNFCCTRSLRRHWSTNFFLCISRFKLSILEGKKKREIILKTNGRKKWWNAIPLYTCTLPLSKRPLVDLRHLFYPEEVSSCLSSWSFKAPKWHKHNSIITQLEFLYKFCHSRAPALFWVFCLIATDRGWLPCAIVMVIVVMVSFWKKKKKKLYKL